MLQMSTVVIKTRRRSAAWKNRGLVGEGNNVQWLWCNIVTAKRVLSAFALSLAVTDFLLGGCTNTFS